MVAVIRVSQSIHRILNYNENKVKQAKATCIAAVNYPVDAPQLSFRSKLNRFTKQMQRNANVKRNSLHISLNFDPSEKDIATEKLIAIAGSYMEKLGFARQPYLVYRHFDAGHPHIHLVTTNIEADGRRIDLHHLAIKKSEPARKEIEVAFGLVRAQAHRKDVGEHHRAPTVKAVYGISETRAAIQNVLDAVIGKYTYTSLAELNAVLGIYNVRAEQGGENSRIRRHGGLVYRIIDSNKVAVGVPVKASLFHSRPTLARLSARFIKNKVVGQKHKARITNSINRLGPADYKAMERHLAAEGITIVRRENSEGLLYGITYVDHKTGGVFNGSALGKQYSAKAMQERFTAKDTAGQKENAPPEGISAAFQRITAARPQLDNHTAGLLKDIARLVESYTAPEQPADFVPKQFRGRKKKRKRGPGDNH